MAANQEFFRWSCVLPVWMWLGARGVRVGPRTSPAGCVQVKDGVGPSCQPLVMLARRACLFNNALINYCKLQRTRLTIIERSTEAAMKLDVHTNY